MGNNGYGQLGLGHKYNKDYPQELSLENIKMISCHEYYTMALTKSAEVYTWGATLISPQKINLPDISLISSGNFFTIALTTDGVVYEWTTDENNRNQLPHKLDSCDVIKICSGVYHYLALTKYGLIYSWGFNGNGQLGLGHTETCHSPQKINLENIIKIFCGHYSSFAISKSGETYAWGSNGCGKLGLGLGHSVDLYLPQKLNLDNIREISCGRNHTVAITKYDEIYSWGRNEFGQLGLDNKENRYLPQRVKF